MEIKSQENIIFFHNMIIRDICIISANEIMQILQF